MNPREIAPSPASERVITVTGLNRLAREVLEATFPLQWIAGEISNLTRAASGHLYFTLKDDQSQVRCTMWRNKAQLLAFRPEHGMQVEVRALVSLYEPRGDFQLNIEAIRRAGLGNLYEAFLRLKARLEAEGLFDANLKRTLPRFPRGIAVVTSPQAAAWRDVLATLARRAPHVPVCLYPTPVQGDGAGFRIAEAIALAGARASRDGNDVLLLVRGGGSLEDLAAFNDESVARAVRACPIPVVCGVGHETDVSLCDLVADMRAPTPSAAAALVVPERHALLATVQQRAARMQLAMQARIDRLHERLDRAAMQCRGSGALLQPWRERLLRLASRLPRSIANSVPTRHRHLDGLARRLLLREAGLASAQRRLAPVQASLGAAWSQHLDAARQRVEHIDRALALLNPERVLARGYALVQTVDGQLVGRDTAVSAGDALSVHLDDREIAVRVIAARSRKPDKVG